MTRSTLLVAAVVSSVLIGLFADYPGEAYRQNIYQTQTAPPTHSDGAFSYNSCGWHSGPCYNNANGAAQDWGYWNGSADYNVRFRGWLYRSNTAYSSAYLRLNVFQFAWSPDGHHFAATINGSLLILDGETSPKVLPLGQLLPGVDASTVAVVGWTNPTTLMLQAYPGEKLFAVDVSGAELKAVEAGPDALAAGSLPSRGPDPAAEAQVREALGPDEIIWESRHGADGGADAFEVRQPGAGDQPAGLVIRERATGSISRIKALPFDARGGWLYDVLVQQSR